MAATVRYNDDYSEFQLVLDDGTEYDVLEVSEAGIDVMDDNEDPAKNYLVVHSTFDGSDEEGGSSNLQPATVYQLLAVPTEIEEDVEFPEEDGDDDGDGLPVPIAS